MASKAMKDEAVYTPRINMSRAKIFRALCEESEYPCRDCTKCKNPMTCIRLENCPEYYEWFQHEWSAIRKALTVKKPKITML